MKIHLISIQSSHKYVIGYALIQIPSLMRSLYIQFQDYIQDYKKRSNSVMTQSNATNDTSVWKQLDDKTSKRKTDRRQRKHWIKFCNDNGSHFSAASDRFIDIERQMGALQSNIENLTNKMNGVIEKFTKDD